jgi:molybdenum cofactor sulfurtransferase
MDSVFTGYFMPTILAHVEYIQHIPIVLGIGMVLLLVLCIGSSSMFASTVITTPKYPAHCQLQMQQSENEKRSKSNSETRNNLINQDLDRKNNSNKSGERLRTKMAVLKRKRNFMNSAHGEHYGYASSSIGHIDTWREREFPSLIKPVSGHEPVYDSTSTTTRTSHDNEMEEESEVYLDHAGAGIPSKSLLDSMHAQSLKDQVLANPHSNGRAAARTKAAIENVKKQILDFFDANAGCRYGYTCEKEQDRAELEQDYHPGYDVIFTSGTTQALQIVAENFGWSHPGHHGEISDDDEKGRNKSTLLYSHNSHTSVIGMREPALGKGASFQCRQLDEISRATPEDFDRWANQDTTSYGDGEYAFAEHEESDRISEHEAPNHLLVFPLECNFGGTRSNAQNIIQTSHMAKSNWFSMLDIAKAAATSKIHLRALDPDFACVSFYKIFGAPTGIGALFVKRSSRHTLALKPAGSRSGYNHNRKYFGGGAVDIVLPKQDFVRSRSSSYTLDALTSGTINFRSILSLRSGLDEIQRFGMEAVSTIE